jgi:Rieske [2Fe-2S] domain
MALYLEGSPVRVSGHSARSACGRARDRQMGSARGRGRKSSWLNVQMRHFARSGWATRSPTTSSFLMTWRTASDELRLRESTSTCTPSTTSAPAPELCPLSGDLLAGKTIRCQYHGSRFDIVSGAVTNGSAARPLNVYDVQELNGIVRVRVTSSGKRVGWVISASPRAHRSAYRAQLGCREGKGRAPPAQLSRASLSRLALPHSAIILRVVFSIVRPSGAEAGTRLRSRSAR